MTVVAMLLRWAVLCCNTAIQLRCTKIDGESSEHREWQDKFSLYPVNTRVYDHAHSTSSLNHISEIVALYLMILLLLRAPTVLAV